MIRALSFLSALLVAGTAWAAEPPPFAFEQGGTATFVRPGVVWMTSGDVVFTGKYDVDVPRPADEDATKAMARAVCERDRAALIALMREGTESEPTHFAIILRWLTASEEGVRKYIQWTSVYELDRCVRSAD